MARVKDGIRVRLRDRDNLGPVFGGVLKVSFTLGGLQLVLV